MFICIVDDDPAVSDSIAVLLDCHSHQTRIFGSAEEYLAKADHANVDCVIADVRLPGLSGIELIARLRQSGHNTPAIVISGHGEYPSTIDPASLGTVRFLRKPCDPGELIGALNDLV